MNTCRLSIAASAMMLFLFSTAFCLAEQTSVIPCATFAEAFYEGESQEITLTFSGKLGVQAGDFFFSLNENSDGTGKTVGLLTLVRDTSETVNNYAFILTAKIAFGNLDDSPKGTPAYLFKGQPGSSRQLKPMNAIVLLTVFAQPHINKIYMADRPNEQPLTMMAGDTASLIVEGENLMRCAPEFLQKELAKGSNFGPEDVSPNKLIFSVSVPKSVGERNLAFAIKRSKPAKMVCSSSIQIKECSVPCSFDFVTCNADAKLYSWSQVEPCAFSWISFISWYHYRRESITDTFKITGSDSIKAIKVSDFDKIDFFLDPTKINSGDTYGPQKTVMMVNLYDIKGKTLRSKTTEKRIDPSKTAPAIRINMRELLGREIENEKDWVRLEWSIMHAQDTTTRQTITFIRKKYRFLQPAASAMPGTMFYYGIRKDSKMNALSLYQANTVVGSAAIEYDPLNLIGKKNWFSYQFGMLVADGKKIYRVYGDKEEEAPSGLQVGAFAVFVIRPIANYWDALTINVGFAKFTKSKDLAFILYPGVEFSLPTASP
jgi:hypothetical protein